MEGNTTSNLHPDFLNIDSIPRTQPNISKYYWILAKSGKYNRIFIPILDVYEYDNMLDNATEKEIKDYASGFKKGFAEFKEGENSPHVKFLDEVFDSCIHTPILSPTFYMQGIEVGKWFYAWHYVLTHQRGFEPLFAELFAPKEQLKPTLLTIYDTDKERLTQAHKVFTDAGLLKCDLDSWLYWFAGIPCENKSKPIEWTYKGTSALLYFMEKLCPDFGTLEKRNRKIKETKTIFETKINGQSKKSTLPDVKSVINQAFASVN